MAVKQEVLMQQQGEVPLQPLLHELREQGAVAPISPDVAGMDEVKCDPGLGQELDDREGEEDDNPNFVGKGALRRRWRKRATLDQLQVWYLTHLECFCCYLCSSGSCCMTQGKEQAQRFVRHSS